MPSNIHSRLIPFTMIFIAFSAVSTRSSAQIDLNNLAAATTTVCKENKDAVAADFYGAWVLELTDSSIGLNANNNARTVQTTGLMFKQNPEFAESLAGEFSLNSQRLEVFGDVENGMLDFEESANGKDISALWNGRVADGSCGQAITGTRRSMATQAEQRFVLRRAGW